MRRALMPLDKHVAPAASASAIFISPPRRSPAFCCSAHQRSMPRLTAALTAHAATSQVSLRIVTGGGSPASDTTSAVWRSSAPSITPAAPSITSRRPSRRRPALHLAARQRSPRREARRCGARWSARLLASRGPIMCFSLRASSLCCPFSPLTKRLRGKNGLKGRSALYS